MNSPIDNSRAPSKRALKGPSSNGSSSSSSAQLPVAGGATCGRDSAATTATLTETTTSPDATVAASLSERASGLDFSALATSLVAHEQKLANYASSLQAQTNNKADMARRVAKQHKKWNKRLKVFFCCLGYKKNKDSIADVASIFAEFYADLKVPSSDIAAGFVLLSKYQAAQRQWIINNDRQHRLGVEQYLNGIPITASTKFLDLSSADDSHLVNDLIYYLNYSLAIFGWPMHLVDDPCLLCCIYPYLKLSPCCSAGAKRRSQQTKRNRRAASGVSSRSDAPATQKSAPESTSAKGGNGGGGKQSAPADCATQADEDKENNNTDEEQQRLKVDDGTNNQRQAAELGFSKTTKVGQLDEDCDIPIILEDNCCSCNVASAERRLASHNYEIIYVSYKVNVNVVPFLVAADHSKRAIVVAIRGSMSLSDMVTDMNGQIDKVPMENCPDDWLCHRGITRAAMYVKLKLEQERIIERALNCRPDLGSNNYSLVLCGHSLGAGAAAILGVLMRAQYPTLRAYLYSPPGGILSMPVVEYTKEFAIGVILGNDTVPRLGVAQLERLRYHTLLSIKSAQKSSAKILAKALCPTCCFGDNHVEYDPLQSLDLLHGTEGRSFDYSGTTIPFQQQPQVLYVPGRLVHVVKNYSFQASKRSTKTTRLWNGPIYQAIWTDNSIYDRVIISEGMFFDHLPNKLMQAMKMLFCKTLPARSDSSSSTSAAIEAAQETLSSVSRTVEPELPCLTALAQKTVAEKLKSIEQQADDNNNNDNNYDSIEPNQNINNQSPGATALSDSNKTDKRVARHETTFQVNKVQETSCKLEDDDRAAIHNVENPTNIISASKLNVDENGNEQF